MRAKKTAGRHGRGDAAGLPLYPSDVTLMPTPECFWPSEKTAESCAAVSHAVVSSGNVTLGEQGRTERRTPRRRLFISHAPEWRLFYTQVGKHVDLVTSADVCIL